MLVVVLALIDVDASRTLKPVPVADTELDAEIEADASMYEPSTP